MGPASCQVPSSLEAEERDVKEGGWDPSSLSAEAQAPVLKPWWQGEGRGDSCDPCLTCSTPSFVKKRRRPTLGVQLDDKRKEMLKRHPLSVLLDLKCKGLVPLSLGHLLTPRSAASCSHVGVWQADAPLPTKIFWFHISVFLYCYSWSLTLFSRPES